jgi:hypothetical protein
MQRQESDMPLWEDIGPLVDQAIASLPEELRLPLIMQFLQQRSQADIAAELGVNQSTISRRVEHGIERLREALRNAGVMAAAPLLASLMTDNAASATLPATLQDSLAKLESVTQRRLIGRHEVGIHVFGNRAGAAMQRDRPRGPRCTRAGALRLRNRQRTKDTERRNHELPSPLHRRACRRRVLWE